MSAANAILAELSGADVNLRAEGADLIVEGPADLITDELFALLRPHKSALLDLLRTWHTNRVFVEVFAGRIWVSSAERSYGIPLSPMQLNRTKPLDFATLGAALAWILSGRDADRRPSSANRGSSTGRRRHERA
jgi:hypothetical protein